MPSKVLGLTVLTRPRLRALGVEPSVFKPAASDGGEDLDGRTSLWFSGGGASAAARRSVLAQSTAHNGIEKPGQLQRHDAPKERRKRTELLDLQPREVVPRADSRLAFKEMKVNLLVDHVPCAKFLLGAVNDELKRRLWD